jgi:hypothetical protein
MQDAQIAARLLPPSHASNAVNATPDVLIHFEQTTPTNPDRDDLHHALIRVSLQLRLSRDR